MRPVLQTKYFDPDLPLLQQRGNCLTAAVASLLDLPIEGVPNFIEIDVCGGPNWQWHVYSYLQLMGYEQRYCGAKNPPINKHYIVTGLSARATLLHPIHHAVVYFNGKMVHDPHPNNAGLLTEENAWYLERI